MQLKVQHSQKKGMIGRHTFCLDLRAEYSPEEKDRINKYDLGGEVIYSSKDAQKHGDNLQASTSLGGAIMHRVLMGMNLNITVASLGRGQHIECKDLNELMAAREGVIEACKGVKNWLEMTTHFDGSENIIDI